MDNQGSHEPVGEQWQLNPDFHKMSDFLGVNVYDRNDYELAKKVYALKDWAMEKSKGKSINDALWQMRGLQKELGHQFIGKPLITEMYKYVRLTQDRAKEASIPTDSTSPKRPLSESKPQEKSVVKPKAQGGTIQKAVAETVQQSIKGMVNQALGDKKMIEGAVQNAVKEAMK